MREFVFALKFTVRFVKEDRGMVHEIQDCMQIRKDRICDD